MAVGSYFPLHRHVQLDHCIIRVMLKVLLIIFLRNGMIQFIFKMFKYGYKHTSFKFNAKHMWFSRNIRGKSFLKHVTCSYLTGCERIAQYKASEGNCPPGVAQTLMEWYSIARGEACVGYTLPSCWWSYWTLHTRHCTWKNSRAGGPPLYHLVSRGTMWVKMTVIQVIPIWYLIVSYICAILSNASATPAKLKPTQNENELLWI